MEGAPRPAKPLEVTPAQAKAFGEYRVRLDLSPEPAAARDETQLSFTVFQDWTVSVVDLQPFLGAGGHCVALSGGDFPQGILALSSVGDEWRALWTHSHIPYPVPQVRPI